MIKKVLFTIAITILASEAICMDDDSQVREYSLTRAKRANGVEALFENAPPPQYEVPPLIQGDFSQWPGGVSPSAPIAVTDVSSQDLTAYDMPPKGAEQDLTPPIPASRHGFATCLPTTSSCPPEGAPKHPIDDYPLQWLGIAYRSKPVPSIIPVWDSLKTLSESKDKIQWKIPLLSERCIEQLSIKELKDYYSRFQQALRLIRVEPENDEINAAQDKIMELGLYTYETYNKRIERAKEAKEKETKAIPVNEEEAARLSALRKSIALEQFEANERKRLKARLKEEEKQMKRDDKARRKAKQHEAKQKRRGFPFCCLGKTKVTTS